MRFRSPLLLALLLALCLPAAGAAAQGATTGTLRGQVTAENDAPVAGATVTATNPATGFRRSAVTDAAGRFLLPLLPPGTYRVEARGLGYAAAVRAAVAVRAAEAETLEFRLSAQAVALEGITATGERGGGVGAAQGGVATTVRSEQLENLPVQGRDFTDFLNLSPLVSPQPQVGTGGQFSIGGARTSGTNIQIDGTDANNIFFGENRGSSRTPFTFSLESVREFQLITNGFDVEYGNYQGGVMNAVTRDGTNRFEGTAFLYRRDEALTGNDFFGNDPTDFGVQQFGFSFSGPVVRDRLHFFVSADGQVRDQPFTAGVAGVAGLQADSLAQFFQILQTRYGVDADPYYGPYEQDQNNLALFGRVDWTVSDQHRLTLRQAYSDFEQTNDRIGTREAFTSGGPFQDRAWSTVAELNSDFGGSLYNTLRFQYSDEDRPRPAQADGGYLPQLSVTLQTGQTIAFGGDGVLFRNRLLERKLQLVDNLTFSRGAHTFKVGTNNLFSTIENTFWLNGNGSYTFTSLANFRNGVIDRYTRSQRACPVALVNNAAGQQVICPQYDVPVAGFDALEWSVYGQDEWQATDRLLLVAGLRYGGTTFRDEPRRLTEVETAFGVPTGVVPDFTGLSPRLSFTYDLAGEQVVRGGVGLLVGRAPAVLAGNVFQTDVPFRALTCRAPNIPAIDVDEWLQSPDGQNNPAACAGAAGTQGAPEFATFSEDFELPRTWKANLGWEGVLPTGTRVSADAIFSATRDNFTVQDINLRDPQFRAEGGRPVFVPVARYGASLRGATLADRARVGTIDRTYLNGSEGEARAWNFNLELRQSLGETLEAGVAYGHNRAYDNGSFSCCTSFEGIGNAPTAGDLNFFGDPGDDDLGTWARSDFERRHVIVANFLLRAPLGFRVNGIFRSQSGTPWTPTVDGDLNGDGLANNDRAFLGSGLLFNTPADAEKYVRLVADFECLGGQLDRIARRNSCRNPWWHSLDLRLARDIPTFGRQRAELLVDVFNVLNALNGDWGRYVTVSGTATQVLRAERVDAATGRVVYSVNYFPERDEGSRGFGEARPLSFGDPLQFQVQLGIRYRL